MKRKHTTQGSFFLQEVFIQVLGEEVGLWCLKIANGLGIFHHLGIRTEKGFDANLSCILEKCWVQSSHAKGSKGAWCKAGCNKHLDVGGSLSKQQSF